jgi:hypothetical protein
VNIDIRIRTNFFRHPKTVKLIKEFGPDAPIYLMKLWIFSAENRPTGELLGMTMKDICMVMEYSGSPQKIIGAMLRIGFLERSTGGALNIHDWAQHNSYAAHAEHRRSAAQRGASARWENKNKQRVTACPSEKEHMPVPVPSPVPSPVPAPAHEYKARTPYLVKAVDQDRPSVDAMGRVLKKFV